MEMIEKNADAAVFASWGSRVRTPSPPIDSEPHLVKIPDSYEAHYRYCAAQLSASERLETHQNASERTACSDIFRQWKALSALTACLLLAGCTGDIQRYSAKWNGHAEICVNGVGYLQFPTGASVKYRADGSIERCGDPLPESAKGPKP